MVTRKKLTVTRVSIDSVQPHPRNVRQGDIGVIVQSLEAHSQYKPIVVQKSTGNVIAGNHTWRAAKELKWRQIDVLSLDVTDEEALRIMLADNRTSDLANYDDVGLADLLKSLAATDGSLLGTGFDGDDLDDLLFRLDPGLGNMSDALSAGEREVIFMAKGIRSIVLPYPEKQFNEIQDKMTKLRKKFSLETNADLVAYLVGREK